MKVIIPAAGQGTRLRPHTHTIPKVMLPVAGRPIIGHILADVAALGPDEVRLVVGYEGESVESYAREAFPDLSIRVVWQEEQLGLGHAVLQGLDRDDPDAVLVVLGDTVFDVDYADVVGRGANALGVCRVPDPGRFGIVELDDDGETVTRLIEKPDDPSSDLALAGLYYVEEGEALRAAIAGLVEADETTRGEYQLTDALQRMIEADERFVAVEIAGWHDCGKPETLLETNRALLEKGAGEHARPGGEDAVVVPPVSIARGCTVERSVVGPYVTLGEGAVVRDSVVRDAILGASAVVDSYVLERSILGTEARARGRPAHLDLGDDSSVGVDPSPANP